MTTKYKKVCCHDKKVGCHKNNDDNQQFKLGCRSKLVIVLIRLCLTTK